MSSDLNTRFENAVKIIMAKPVEGQKKIKLDVKTQLTFYALYKQATEGKNTTKEPSKMDAVNNYKWKAWTSLGDMSKDDAKKKYLEQAEKLMPPEIKAKL